MPQIDTSGLWADVGVLLAGLGCFLALVAAARLRLSRAVGWALLTAYALYLLWVVLSVWVFGMFGTYSA